MSARDDDPSPSPIDPAFVHERIFVRADGRETHEKVVDCPAEGVVPFARCERCPRFFDASYDERHGGEVVDCARAPLDQTSAIPKHLERDAPESAATTVGDLMSRAYVALDAGVPIDVARRYLIDEEIGCLLVLDGQRSPIGIVTLRDFLVTCRCGESTERPASKGDDTAPQADGPSVPRSVGDIASSPVITVPSSLPVARASAMMSFEGVHHLAVVDREGAASGVLSSLDVLRWLGQRAGMLIPRATARQRASSYATAARSKP